jgi:hypothetical protein
VQVFYLAINLGKVLDIRQIIQTWLEG